MNSEHEHSEFLRDNSRALEARTPAPADDTTVRIGENDYADFERCEKPAPAHCQCAECKPWLNAEKPAPTPSADMEALLAEDGYKAVLAALRQEAVDKCGGGFGAPDLNADYQLSLSLLVREVYQILNIAQHIDALATALRETLARHEALHEEHYQEMQRVEDALRGRDSERARAEREAETARC